MLEKELLDLQGFVDMQVFDFDLHDIVEANKATEFQEKSGDGTTLAERFGVPPFSILDKAKGYWQDRKQKWLAIGLNPQNGRDDDLICGMKGLAERLGSNSLTGTSMFDPVLCEIMYSWFCPHEGVVLDPFAGGAVRGVVAHKLGFTYYGNDLRREQINDNYIIGQRLCGDNVPNWTCGDSTEIFDIMDGREFDFVFTCPPYADLEVYSDLPEDLSNMPYDEFLTAYRKIIAESVKMLKNDRFAVIVVGDIRDKKGFYRDFISDTKAAFKDSGMQLYNELILVEPVATGALRADAQFSTNRKVVKRHQNVIVFYKGDQKNIRVHFSPVYVGDIDEITQGADE